MGFDITLKWLEPSSDPVGRNRTLALKLLSSVRGLAEFPLDHGLVATLLGVPQSKVLEYWSQIQLTGDDQLIGAIVSLWLDRAFVELPSVPNGSCEEALSTIRPLIIALEAEGIAVEDPEQLLAEYEAQRARVIRVVEIINAPGETI